MKRDQSLNQYFTSFMIATALVRHYGLHENNVVLDPACGDGRMLSALVPGTTGYGIEIDPELIESAKTNSGCEIYCADATTFQWSQFEKRPDTILTNPPFSVKYWDALIAAAYEHFDYGNRIIGLIPAYFLQTANTVLNHHDQGWSMNVSMTPRNQFQGLSIPLCVIEMEKERANATLSGFLFYKEVSDILGFEKKYRDQIIGNKSVALWVGMCESVIRDAGGTLSLKELYSRIEGKRPTRTKWWKEQIRKVCKQNFVRVARGVYQLPDYEKPAANDEGQLYLFGS